MGYVARLWSIASIDDLYDIKIKSLSDQNYHGYMTTYHSPISFILSVYSLIIRVTMLQKRTLAGKLLATDTSFIVCLHARWEIEVGGSSLAVAGPHSLLDPRSLVSKQIWERRKAVGKVFLLLITFVRKTATFAFNKCFILLVLPRLERWHTSCEQSGNRMSRRKEIFHLLLKTVKPAQ